LRVVIRHGIAHALRPRVARWKWLAAKISPQDLSGPERLRRALEEIGGTFIKFGQMLAIQSDLLPLEYCRGLFSLFDNVPPFDYKHVEETFLQDLNSKPLELFDSFDPEPIATGSIGQVHVAYLGKRKLAVKVRRPTALMDFGADIAALKIVVRAVRFLRVKKFYWIIQPTEEFLAWTQDELDYRKEAHYMDELERYARDNPFERIPIVLWNYTTARILTTDFLEGVTISEYLRDKSSGREKFSPDFVPNLFSGRLIDNFLRDAFGNGMFHADLHPGNLMILAGNVVGYIDFGISGVLSRYSRKHLVEMTLAYTQGDTNAMCDSFFQISTFAENADTEGFRRRLKELSVGWYGEGSAQARFRKSISNVMLDLLILSRDRGVWPQRDVVKYIRSAIALDGLINTVTPSMDVGRHLERACEQNLKWDAFRKLISAETLDGLLSGSTHLLQDSILRAFAALQHAGARPSLTLASFGRKRQKPRKSLDALHLAWISLCMAFVWEPNHHTASLAQSMVAYLLWAAVSVSVWHIMKRAHAI
jgi:ubiquinone biosynthesis protein